MAMNPRLLRPTANDSPASIPGLALWLDAAAADALYTTDAGPVTAVSSPLDISGCVFWLDASNTDTVSVSGSDVTSWTDAINAVSLTPTGSVTVGASLNGLATVRLNGAGTKMIGSGTLGGAIGPLMAGRIFDLTGSYRMVFLILTAMAVVGFILITTLQPPAQN